MKITSKKGESKETPKESTEEINENSEKILDLESKIKDLESKSLEYLSGWQRCRADWDNYQKSQEEWAKNYKKFCNEEILTQVISVIDNFSLALKHVPENSETSSWKQGIEYIKKQLDDLLVNNNVVSLETKKGDIFNPYLHFCVEETQKECPPEKEADLIIEEVVREGYKFHDKIIRPAQVKVTKK